MSFLEYMVSHLQYFDGSQMFGLFRVILWALVRLISSLCSAAEGIYNHIFSLVGVIYNDNVVRFLQGWMGFIWIPIAISVLYLGYSLIMGDAAEGNMRAKTFARNVCLFILIVVGVPYLFIGHADTDSASLFVNSNVTSYTPESSVSSNSGILDFFSDDSGQGIINGVSSMARGSSDNTTKTQALIAGNLIDLKTVYMDTLYLHNNGTNMATTSWMDYLESGQIRKNQFYKRGTTYVVNGSGILETNITEKISVDNLKKEDFGDGDEGESFHISDVLVSSYEYCDVMNGGDLVDWCAIFVGGAVRLRLQSWRRGVPAQRRREEYLSRKRRQLYAPAGRFCDLPQQRLPSKFAYRRGDRCERRRVHDDRGQHQRRRRRVVLYQYRQRKHALSVLVDYAGLYLNRFSGRVDPNERRQLYGWRRNAV